MQSAKRTFGLAGLVGLVLLLASAGRARAQTLEPPTGRQGYYVGAGLYGVANTSFEDGDTLGPWGGNAFALRLGQLLTRRFGLGLQIDFGGTKGDGQTASLGGLNLEAQWTLWRTLAVKGGAGIGFVQLKDPRVEDEKLRGGAGGQYTVGLSYDFFPWRNRLTGGWSVTPAAAVRFLPTTSASTLVVMLGVEVLWWSGLPREQLDLPDAEAYKKH